MALWESTYTIQFTVRTNTDPNEQPTLPPQTADELYDIIRTDLEMNAPGWFTHLEGAEWWITDANGLQHSDWKPVTKQRVVHVPALVEGEDTSAFIDHVVALLDHQHYPIEDPAEPRVIRALDYRAFIEPETA